MSEDVHSMWESLMLDLAAHDALLGCLARPIVTSMWHRRTGPGQWATLTLS
jgi:hypothetical protein